MGINKDKIVKIKYKDARTKSICIFSCMPCPNCGKWIVVNGFNFNQRYCEYCGMNFNKGV